MKVSEIRGKINQLSNGDRAISSLSEALKRFDDMPLEDFLSFLRSRKVPQSRNKDSKKVATTTTSVSEEAFAKIKSLMSNADAFEAELDRVAKNRAFTKKKLQQLYVSIFDTKSYLPDKLTKPEMIARIKRQRRRDANFASA